MEFGRFSDDGREFVITDVRTPSPWINYLENGRYFATISANGGGISYDRSPLHGRITRYRINDVPHDRPGKYIYVKDRDTGEVWSLTWQPVGREPAAAYRVAHGFGYTRAEAEVEGIASSVVFFVPADDDREIWKAVLTNRSGRARRLAVVGYVELALGHALVDLINQCDDQHFNRVHFEKGLDALFATKTYWVTETRGTQHQENKEWDRWAYFTVNRPVAAYETVRERFIGPFRSESNPIALERGLGSEDMDCGNAVAALEVDLEIAPGESADVIFSLGVIAKPEFERTKAAVVGKYRDAASVDAALDRVREAWDRFFSHTRAATPDAEADVFLNFWTPYQAKVAFDVGRVASFYYWGIGRGFGYRDTAQDTIAIAIADAARARARVGLLARQMRRDGKVYHHFYGDGQGEFTEHCDDPLWFILAATEYLKETGDFGLLDAAEPFLDGGEGTVLDHLMAVAGFAGANLGPHGLPKFGRGDWNDTLDYIGGKDGGESVWGAMFYVAMLDRLHRAPRFREGGREGRGRARAPRPAGGGDRGPRLGRRLVHPRLRRSRTEDRLEGERRGPHLHQHPELGRHRRAAGPGAARPGHGQPRGAPRHAVRPEDLRPGVPGDRSGDRPHHAVRPGQEGERRRLLPPGGLGHPGRVPAGAGRAGLRVLQEAPARADRPGDVLGRALCLLAVHHERRAPGGGEGQPFLADRHGRLDVPGGLRPHPRREAVVRRAGHRPGRAAVVDAVPRRAGLPRGAVHRRGREPGRRRARRPVDRGRRRTGRRGPSRRVRPARSAGCASEWGGTE